MRMKVLLLKALFIALKAHKGQRDKGGHIYILHPVRVAMKCENDDERIVALLHDTIEDTYVTAEYLREKGFPDRLIEAVLSVTRKNGETYDDFVKRAKRNTIGRMVKRHDLEDNMDVSRLKVITDKDRARLSKYKRAYQSLLAPLPQNL